MDNNSNSTVREIEVVLIPNGPLAMGTTIVCSDTALIKTQQLWSDAQPGCGLQVICYTQNPHHPERMVDMTNHGWLRSWQQDFTTNMAPGWIPAEIALQIASGVLKEQTMVINGNEYHITFTGDWSKAPALVSKYPDELAFLAKLKDFRFLTPEEIETSKEKNREFWEKSRKRYDLVQQVIDEA